MTFQDNFPIWNKLTKPQQDRLLTGLVTKTFKKGTVIHNGSADCTGLLLIHSGQLRAYILSDEGREITIYRLFDRDMCLFSASCMMRSIQFDINIEAEKDTELWVIPTEIYKSITEESTPVANYTNELMATRFSDVMWLIESILWKSLDRRLAAFLLEEAAIENTNERFLGMQGMHGPMKSWPITSGLPERSLHECCGISRAKVWSPFQGAASP